MLSATTRTRTIAAFPRLSMLARAHARAGYSSTASRFSASENPNPANASPEPAKPNVSGTNATPVEDPSAFNKPLQESPEVGEHYRELQAPNRATTWARSQQPREAAMTGPRFEQTIMELQVSGFKAY